MRITFILGRLNISMMLASCCLTVQAEEASVPVNIPAEFLSLWERHMELVEVKLYGRNLGLFQIAVMPDTIEFTEPERIIHELNVSEEQSKVLVQYLQKPLPRNGNRSCQGFSDAESNCNYLKTDTVAVIMDETDNSLYLFVNEKYISNSDSDMVFWQPTANSKNALIHSQVMNFSDDKYSRTFNLSGDGALGITRNSYAVIDWNLNYYDSKKYSYYGSNDVDATVNSLYYRYDLFRRYYLQAGRMDSTDLSQSSGGSFNFSLMPIPRTDGIRIGTTQSYLRNRNEYIATPVTVMLTRYSRVEAYQGRKLLGTWYLEPGVQKINTSRLPEGSYTLELRIFEQDTLVRTEQVPFNKSSARQGDLQWDGFIQAGRVAENRYYFDSNYSQYESSKDIVEGGLRLPLFSSTSLSQGIAAFDGSYYAESRIDWGTGLLNGTFSGAVAFLWGDDGAQGNSQNLSYSNGASLSLYHYEQKSDHCWYSGDLGWSGCNETYSASLSIPVARWSTVLGYSDNRNSNQFRKNIYQEWVDNLYRSSWEIFQSRSRTWQLSASTSYLWKNINITPNFGIYRSESQNGLTDKGGFLSVSLSRNQKLSESINSSFSAGYTYRDSRSRSSSDYYVNGQVSRVTEGAYNELSVRASGNDSSYSGVIQGRNNSRFGNLNGSLGMSQLRDTNENSRTLSLAYDSSFALSSEGLFWGGNASTSTYLAGSTIAVNGSKDDEPLVSLRGNDGNNVVLSSGQRQFVPLSALTPSEVNVSEVATGDINVQLDKSGDKKLFMLPGHIYPHNINAVISLTYIGRALDSLGRPISEATILNTPATQLEQDGGFIFEYSHIGEALFLLKDGEVYSCPVTGHPAKNAVLNLGEVICEKTDRHKLPVELTLQERVSRLLARR
ncbi:TcfC E-set like domain-containing protein [Escherichia coli]|nr:TcfC E-set like domain-containing protein [Escherichia coli]EIC8564217.1 TcfC E-set like domain-containing protein [Escherichia coli]EMB1662706.1 TcfC E-set like domain-containing protein [Escherichia coli]